MKKKPVSEFASWRHREYTLKDCKLTDNQMYDIPIMHNRNPARKRAKEFIRQYKIAMKEHYNEPNYGHWIEC